MSVIYRIKTFEIDGLQHIAQDIRNAWHRYLLRNDCPSGWVTQDLTCPDENQLARIKINHNWIYKIQMH